MRQEYVYFIVAFVIVFDLVYTYAYINNLNLSGFGNKKEEAFLINRDSLIYRDQEFCAYQKGDIYVNDLFSGHDLDCFNVPFGEFKIKIIGNRTVSLTGIKLNESEPKKTESFLNLSYNGSLEITVRNGINKGVISFANVYDKELIRSVPFKLMPNEMSSIIEDINFCGKKSIKVEFQGLEKEIDIKKNCEEFNPIFGLLLIIPLYLFFKKDIYKICLGFLCLIVSLPLISNIFGIDIFYGSIALLIILTVISFAKRK